jgi:hypothetical protein
MEEQSIQMPPPLLLAYLGDAVMEVMVREHLIGLAGMTSAKCNKLALEFVTAAHQAEAAKRVKELLTEEEQELFTRAKNAKSNEMQLLIIEVPSACVIDAKHTVMDPGDPCSKRINKIPHTHSDIIIRGHPFFVF